MEGSERWWAAQGSAPFSEKFALTKSAGEGSANYDTRTVERHGQQFHWKGTVYLSASDLKRQLLDYWHEHLYPVLDEQALHKRRQAADAVNVAAAAVTDADLDPSYEAALRDTVWRAAAAAAANADASDGLNTASAALPTPLRRRADLLVDLFGGVIARGAAPESLCWWEPSPCFPLSRGGLRAPPNLLPLHAAAHRHRRELILSAVVRNVVAAGEDEVAADAAAAAAPDGSSADKQLGGGGRGGGSAAAAAVPTRGPGSGSGQRIFLVVGTAGGGAGNTGDGSRCGEGAAAEGAELRPLRVGPSPASLAAVWVYVRAAVAATGPTTMPAVGAANAALKGAGGTVPEPAGDAAAAAEVQAAAAALTEDVLCSNWARLPEGMLERSLPYRQLQLCGAAEVVGGGGAAAADLLRTYLSCCAAADGATEAAAVAIVERSSDRDSTPAPAGEGGAEGIAGGGEGERLTRARAALAAALDWWPTGRRPGLGELILEGATAAEEEQRDVGASDPRVSRGAPATADGANATTESAAAAAGSAADGSKETEARSEGVEGRAAAATVTSGRRITRPVGAPWLPRARRPPPLSPPHPQPVRHPVSYVLWPPEPRPVARWVLVDEHPAAQAEAEAHEAEQEADASYVPAVKEQDEGAVTPERRQRPPKGSGGRGGGEGERSPGPGAGLDPGSAVDPVVALPASLLFPTTPAESEVGQAWSPVAAADGDEAATAERAGGGGAGGGRAGAEAGASEAAATREVGASRAADAGEAEGGGGEAAVLTPAAAARAAERAERARRAARRRAVATRAAAEAAGRIMPLNAAAPSPPVPQPPSGQQPSAGAEGRSHSSGDNGAPWPGSQTAEPMAAAAPQQQLPGLRHLPPEASASMEQAFAAAATSGRRSHHLRSVPVPGVAASTAAFTQAPAVPAAPAPADRSRPSPRDPLGAATAPVHPAAAGRAAAQAAAAAGSAVPDGQAPAKEEPQPLPGLQLLPPEAAASLEQDFRQAMAAGRRNDHMRSAQLPAARPAAAAVAPASTVASAANGGTVNAAAVAVSGGAAAVGGEGAALGWQSSPRQAQPHQDQGDYYYIYYGDVYDQYVPYEQAVPPPMSSSRLGRCFGLLGPAGHVTTRRDEQDCRMEQYRSFVRLTRQSRPT